MRYTIYVGVSALLANVVLLRAYYERPNFYSAAVYISQSNGSLMLLVNLALICTISFGYGLQRLLYGPLRPIETEQLYDKAWFAVSETLLAMTIFRDDIGIWFFVMFLLLLGGKVWQWIGEGRVEFLEQQPPANPRLFHTRLSVSLVLSIVFHIYMMRYCIDTILQEARPGMMVMFAFEYALLAIASMSILLRYALTLCEMFVISRQTRARTESRRVAREQGQQRARSSTDTESGAGVVSGSPEADAENDEDEDDDWDVPGWEDKGRWVFYLDLTTDFIKSLVYCGFFTMLVAFHGIPIHIMRDLYITLRSFFKRINDFVQYRNATRDMNARYPDATAEELARESTCIVCREEMRPWTQPAAEASRSNRRVDERQRPKKLPCGHILHFGCLRSWLERQQVCPTCRRPVLSEAIPPRAPAANQGNQAQAQQNMQNNLQNILNLGVRNQHNQPQGGQNPQQGGQANRPANGMRVFNIGPLRIAYGNLHAAQANNPVNPIANIVQGIAQNQQRNAQLGQIFLQGQPMNGMVGGNPADIQFDILRLQENIINSIRQLHAQHDQLEYIQALLGELHRIQQPNGGPAGVQLPNVPPLNPNLGTGAQRAYLPIDRSAAMGPGHPELPAGLALPEGYTLRRMFQVPPLPEGPTSVNSIPTPQSLPSDHIRRALYPESFGASGQQNNRGNHVVNTATTSVSGTDVQMQARPAVPGEVHSGLSFGQAEDNSASGAQAGGASSTTPTQSTSHAVTVEDVDDDNNDS
ncbi:hypothetical protein K432DRAFT_406289 [Lepidopterella palustris CBS 459.81]|uniref:RING-type E3 ubiquitin transferase n=1 Tax=Lepidopterella palustris CBS 459.81 TaxID=1314670 RepID=A0A8E2E752_9PEZI|nr:hypothetical protein K432DRAFT_406289 [Lepidopterella palustris CBS 459.81]